MVSVRSGAEARLALAGGADLIDVKEPTRGALGAAAPAVWADVLDCVAGAVPTSVALGEIGESRDSAFPAPLARFQYAKWGLAHTCQDAAWLANWARRLAELPPGVTPVAVVYADWPHAESPPPEEIIEAAAGLGCGAVLFDTFDKRRGGLLDHLSGEQLDCLADAARRGGLRVVFGGSLDPQTIPRVLPLQPDYVAVRGAVCRRARTGDLETALVRQLRALVRPVA